MSLIEDLKSVGKTLNDIGKVEEYQKILESWEKIMEMQQMIDLLQKEKEELESKLNLKSKTVRRDNVYFIVEEGQEVGPICSRCWEKDRDQITLQPNTVGPWHFICPQCDSKVRYKIG